MEHRDNGTRHHDTRHTNFLSSLALAALLLLPLAACGGDATESATPKDDATTSDTATETAAASDVQSYEVRGQITGLPDDADPQANLTIRHEAIDEFVSMNGEVVGMSSMSMPFPVAEDVDLEGMEVGSKVRFTLTVDWEGDPAYQVTSMEPLPEDTELEYRNASPGGEPEEMDHDGMDHEGMDDEGMDHEGMDHEGMDHEGMDHEGMDHEGDSSGT